MCQHIYLLCDFLLRSGALSALFVLMKEHVTLYNGVFEQQLSSIDKRNKTFITVHC